MNLAQRLRTFVIVAGVTLVIWLYAEAESLTRVEEDASVALVSRSDDSTLRIDDPDWRGVARLRLEGSAAAISRAPRSLELALGDPALPAVEGEHAIDLRAALAANPALTSAGVALLRVDPPTVRVRISSRQTIPDAQIRAEVSGVALAGEPTVEPARATIVGPRETLDRLAGALGGAAALARVPPQAAAAAEEGKPTTITVRLALPLGFDETDVTITPREANVTITRGAADSWPAPPPVVRVLLPASAVSKWRVEPSEAQRFVRGVVISGPPGAVERFRSGELTIGAVVSLSPEELEKKEASKPVSFVAERAGAIIALPPGISVAAPETAIHLTIEPVRASGETVAPAPAPK